jgi:hypothetical protein
MHGIQNPSEVRVGALALLILGAWSFGVMGLPDKLSWSRSIDFWDFSQSVTPFFAHWASVLVLPTIIVHYAMLIMQKRLSAKS